MATPDAWWCNGTIHCDPTPAPAREIDLFVSISAAYWVEPGDDNRQEVQQ